MVFEFVIGVIGLVCAILVIYDVAANRKKMNSGSKVLWIICAILFSIITAIIYYLVVYKKK
jgi:prolipoprotein diacylglyceryltransferase